MKCPYCGYNETKVVDSRSTDDNMAIRRRRECLRCNKRYTTYEKIENVPILVVKKNMNREYFDRTKILNGLIKACEKRPVSRKQIENITDEVEKKINNNMITEISSSEIGEIIMENLKKVDEVSYVRFASVYRQFKDINTFMQEIKNLISNK
ncbi:MULTISPECIES: transcriptional regulator NrdR [Clostridium]|uniref:Transcriptional repressor NrdR n=5 Tax=Clostridium TaxID=1485 RepID=A0A168L5S7_9CLOT|nr:MULTISPECIES: transcriptional regulator NrdR [Clostridium]ADK14303.1 predicted transcriptional regulator [Clostridium ljungdahlii DSM 13528]AGY77520.1 transcriptional regulator NrdR [Clostridium autoethanogenum DSM 10061]ALU37661.1 Transcriptional repressor NrdR [Clostridium autoethanogenum DSM 10061]OAA82699.1 Transcriptional repressor NrdR [Clostridium ljungdahlii]OAA88276.1 Transcriptional repressor NrdR [Clostridium ljungdahlii DSM 13528]